MNRVSWYPLALGLLAVAGAAAAFEPAFAGTRWITALVVAVLMSGAVMAWTVATRTGAITATLLSAVAAVLTTTATVLYNTVGQSITTSLSDFFDGLSGGWNDSLQEDLPLVQPTLPLVWVTVMVWLTAAIVARALAAGRASLAVFLAPSILLALATAITVPSGTPSRVPVAVVAVGLLGVLATTTSREMDWSWGQIRGIALVVTTAVAVGLVAMTASVGDTEGAFDPRTLRSDDASDEDVPDLLAQLSNITSAEPTGAMNLRVTDGAQPTRMRMAVYDDYDGVRWQTTTTFREILVLTPPPIQPPGDASTVQVQLIGSPGPWLPLLDRVISISPSVRGWDEESGTALADALLTTVRGSVVTEDELADITAAATDVDPRFTTLPASTPPAILDLAAATTVESADARTAVTALRDAVLEVGRDDSVPSGHSLGRLASDVESLAPMAPEQLVTLHAILVRAVGIPSRVVVGYAIGDDQEISTSDLIAWTEVAFAGVGWVAFDPVPAEEIVLDSGDGEATATTTIPGQAVTEAQVVPRELSPGERDRENVRGSSGSGIGWADVAKAAGGLILLLIAAIAVSRRARRRNRRRGTSAPWSIAGAWGELLDRLRENSSPAPPNRTVEEAIDQVEEMAPRASASLREFTKLVNLTLYSDMPPTWDDAEDAWGLLGDIEEELRESQGRSVALKARFDPRSLRYPTPRPAPGRARRPHPPRPRRTDHPRVQN